MTGRPVRREEQTRLAEAIHELEAGLLQDDPDFVRRMRRLPRAEAARNASVAALLVLSIVLLTAGLAARSAEAWVGGAVVFFAAVAWGSRRDRHRGEMAVIA